MHIISSSDKTVAKNERDNIDAEELAALRGLADRLLSDTKALAALIESGNLFEVTS